MVSHYYELASRYNELVARYYELVSRYNELVSRYFEDIFFLFFLNVLIGFRKKATEFFYLICTFGPSKKYFPYPEVTQIVHVIFENKNIASGVDSLKKKAAIATCSKS